MLLLRRFRLTMKQRKLSTEASKVQNCICNSSTSTSSSSSNPSCNLHSKEEQNLLSSLKTLLVVIISSVVICIACRNTLTWYFQRFWGASGDFWDSQWEKICVLFNYNQFNMFVWGSFLVTFSVYWGVGLLYTWIDLTGKPSFFLRYKIQDPKVKTLTLNQVIPVIKQVLFNQMVVGIPFVITLYCVSQLRGMDESRKLPYFQLVLFQLAVFILIEEIAFYYSHRVLHHPLFYKHIHKQHHEWTSPIAITSIYCHPFEHICSNLMPIIIGPLIMGSHLATSWLWFSIATLFTLNAHSGYHFPFFPSPEAHDFHHLKFNNNFGVLGVLDRLHGTDSNFRKTRAYDRHIMLLSLVPIKTLCPRVKEGKSLDFDE